MIRAFTADAVRAAERPLLEAGEPLMLRAARALASRVLSRFDLQDVDESEDVELSGLRVLVLAGPGANGGDGLYAAALLRGLGVRADAFATSETVHTEAADALRQAGGSIFPPTQLDELPSRLEDTDLVLDAILGIGGRPEVPASLLPVLAAVRDSGVPVIAVDVPSFIDATTGQAAEGALAATETVTFGAVKSGLLLPPAEALAGSIHLADLGLGPYLPEQAAVERLEDADVRTLWPTPHRDASKYTRGVIGIVAGSTRFPGAAVLACSGAARAGAGVVRCIAPDPVRDLVLRVRPEVVGHPGGTIDLEEVGRTDALVVGPGLPGDDPRIRSALDLLVSGGELERGVIDAGGLDALGTDERLGPDVVLTPHRGEADRLAERLGIDTELPAAELARALAAATGATVLLKGATTVVAPGDGGPLRSQADATAQLAAAGTGDVLAGILGALLAVGLTGPDAAALASLLHGRAGRAASREGLIPLVALEVADHIPGVIGTILATAP